MRNTNTAIEADRDHLFAMAVRYLRPARVVLDIGPGIQPQTLVACDTHLCCEPCEQYASALIENNPNVIVLRATAAVASEVLPSRSVDTVVMLDVLEHLDKEDGQRALEFASNAARGQVVVFTPLGFVPQGEGETRDAWGLAGTDWRIHQSVLLPAAHSGPEHHLPALSAAAGGFRFAGSNPGAGR